jgi:hypothetical protein
VFIPCLQLCILLCNGLVALLQRVKRILKTPMQGRLGVYSHSARSLSSQLGFLCRHLLCLCLSKLCSQLRSGFLGSLHPSLSVLLADRCLR